MMRTGLLETCREVKKKRNKYIEKKCVKSVIDKNWHIINLTSN